MRHDPGVLQHRARIDGVARVVRLAGRGRDGAGASAPAAPPPLGAMLLGTPDEARQDRRIIGCRGLLGLGHEGLELLEHLAAPLGRDVFERLRVGALDDRRGQRVEQVDVARDALLVAEGGVGRLVSTELREKAMSVPPRRVSAYARRHLRGRIGTRASAAPRAAMCSSSRCPELVDLTWVSSSEPAVSITTSAIARRASSDTCEAMRAAASVSLMPRSSTSRAVRTSAGRVRDHDQLPRVAARASTSSGTS